MSLTKTSSSFLKLLLPHLNKINHHKDKNIDKIIRKIYKNIKLSNEYYNEIFKGKEIKKHLIKLNDENRDEILENFSLLKNNTFVPENIQTFIKKNIKCIENYNFVINSINFTVEFIVCDNKEHKIYLKKIIILLNFLLSFFVPHIESLKISLCFTDKKKLLPEEKKQTLTKDHINTALTYACKKDGEILLYRKEEWFKVLIHELMHSLCFDFAGLNMSFAIQKQLKSMFSVNSDFHITETYSEFLLVPYFGACIHVPPPPSNQVVYVTANKPLKETTLDYAVWASGILTTKSASSEYAFAGYTMNDVEIEEYKE